MIIDLTETAPGEWSRCDRPPAAQLPPPAFSTSPRAPSPSKHEPFWGDAEGIAIFLTSMGILFCIKHFF